MKKDQTIVNRDCFDGLTIKGECNEFSVIALEIKVMGMNAPILIVLVSLSRLQKIMCN